MRETYSCHLMGMPGDAWGCLEDAWGCLEDAWTLEAPISWQLTHVVNLRQLWALAREHII